MAQYIDSHLNVTETYPANPNASALGITVISKVDGHIAAMMSHPERVFRAVSNSWYPEDWSEDGAWMRGPVIDLETGYIFAIILVLTVLKLHKTDGDHLRKKV